MYRAPLVILSLLLVCGASAAARTAGRPTPTTLAEVRGSITSLAQNGRRVAWIVPHAPCGRQVQILTLPGRHAVSVGSRRGRSCADSARFGDIFAISLASDGRVLWQASNGHGNTELEIDLFTATPRAPPERLVAGFEMSYDAGDPDDYWLTHGSLAAADDGATILIYAYCSGGGCGPREPRAIYRLIGGRLKRLVKVKSPAALAVGGRRFAFVANTPHCCSFTPIWSHDGKRLAWIYDGGLWTVRPDGTEPRQLAAEASHPSWSPDGARIVFDHVGADRQRGVYRVDAAGGDLRRLAAGTSPAWSPDGSTVAFVRGQEVYANNPDGTNERQLTTVTRPTTGPLSWSPDSTRIAVARGGDVYSVRADGTGETRVTTSPHPEGTPAWSPDGAKIAYVDGSARAIYVVNENGTGVTRLTSPGSDLDSSPSWSPDSSGIAFVRRSGFGELWVVNAAGGGTRQLGGDFWDSPQWSPDGSTIAVGDLDPNINIEGRSSNPGLRLVSPITGKARKITPNRSTVEVGDVATGRPTNRFTIDGRAKAIAFGSGYVALLVSHEPHLRVELYDLNGRLRTAAAVPASVRTVSAAGNSVVFAAGRVIDRLDARSGAVTQLTTASRAPVGLTIEGHRVVWAENATGRSRVRAVTAP